MISARKAIPEALFWGLLVAALAVGGWQFWERVLAGGGELIAFSWQGRDYEILAPLFFGGLLVTPLVWALQWRTLSDLPRAQRWVNITLRTGVIVALVLALVQVVVTSFESRVATIFIVDTSASMPDSALEAARTYINEVATAKGERDMVRVVAFAQRPYELALGEDGKLAAITRPVSEPERLETDAASALRMAYGLFPQDHLKRVVVLSDGNATRGDLVAEAYRASAYGIRIYNRELPIDPAREVLIRGVDVPDEIKIGEPFLLTARVFSTYEVEATLSLVQNDFKDGTQKVKLVPGVNEVSFKTQVYEPGFREFKLAMKVDGPDQFAPNNNFTYSTNVHGKPRILYIEGELRARIYLERALRGENFEIETRGPMGVPTTLKELESYDLVLLSDVAATFLSNNQMAILDQYVKTLGGGFIMAGGESSFGPGGYLGAPIEKMMPVKFDSQKKRDTPALALALVIDKSGSMNGDRIELAKDAAKATVELLNRNDKVGVVAFDDGVQQLVRMQSATNRVRIASDISRLKASGGTNIAAGLQSAYEQLAVTSARLKHIILLTDGISDSANIFSEVLPAMRIEGITVSTIAIGNQSETVLLRRIAEGGGGRYYYTNDPYNVPRIFMKETSTVSRTSLVEEPFKPRIHKRAQVLNGIPWESAPYLLGYVSTKAKDGAEEILRTEQGEPLLTRWRYGLGKSVAFTSDLKNRWAVEWIKWPGYAKFWAQLIRDTMRSDDRDSLPMRVTQQGGVARMVVDAIDEEDRFINDLKSKVQITSPTGKKQEVELVQTAPGRYEAEVPLKEYGAYTLKAEHDRDGDTIAISTGSAAYPYPEEYLFTEPNREILRRVADIGLGQTDPPVAELWDAHGEEVKYRRELWPMFVLAALGLLLLDLAMRRVRLWGATELSWDRVTRR
jgi:Ca-activated chloride channel homolog